MRIAFVNSMRSLGGGERWIVEAARGLADRGHEIAVAARSGSELARRSRASGHATIELPMSGDGDLGSVVRLSSWFARRRSQIVCASVQRAVRIGSLAARLARVAAVVERRGLSFPPKISALNRFTYGRLVSRVIANCAAISDGLLETGLLPASRIVVIPNGIDPDRVPTGGGEAVREELGVAPDAPLVAIVGRLVRDKGHADAFAAFASVVRELPRARLLVVGDGKLRDELRHLASGIEPAGSIIFAGHRPDVPAILDAADVVAVTSLREGMPHVILEAMTAGTPVAATTVAGIPEMIEGGRDGLLVPPDSPEEMARALLTILTDGERAARFAEAARRRVETEFSLTGMIDRVERCFAEEIEAVARGER